MTAARSHAGLRITPAQPTGPAAGPNDQSFAAPEPGRLELTAKLYQRDLWPSVLEVAAGRRLGAPLVVDLDPTTYCDLACPECISGTLLNQGRFTRARLVELGHELVEAGVRAVVLIGGGEPLAHTGTADLLSVLGGAGLSIGLVTNGTMIHRHVDALATWASWVRVSVDAATADTFGRVRPDRRGASRFEDVISNMRSFAEVKTGVLGYSFLLVTRTGPDGSTTFTNAGEVVEAARLARSIGCDYFELKAMFDMDHFVVDVSSSTRRVIEEQLEGLAVLADEGFEVDFSSTVAALEGGARPQHKTYTSCPVTELRTLITPSGAYACSYHRGNPSARIGDLVTESFGEMWERGHQRNVDPTIDCGFQCARHPMNEELLQIGRDPSRSVVDSYDPFL